MNTVLQQGPKSPIAPRMKDLAKVEIGRTDISASEYTPIVSSTNDFTLQREHLMLKPLTHFSFHQDTGTYVLNINIHVGNGYSVDENNAVECLSTGKNVLIFLNYGKASESGNVPTYIYNYRIEFNTDVTQKIMGKKILVITSSGDPEEGDTTQVIVEDEDEI